eukprot:11160687-Lingulodinium_polyedra.AAC.1
MRNNNCKQKEDTARREPSETVQSEHTHTHTHRTRRRANAGGMAMLGHRDTRRGNRGPKL